MGGRSSVGHARWVTSGASSAVLGMGALPPASERDLLEACCLRRARTRAGHLKRGAVAAVQPYVGLVLQEDGLGFEVWV